MVAKMILRCHYCGLKQPGKRQPFVDGKRRFVCDVCLERQKIDTAQEEQEDQMTTTKHTSGLAWHEEAGNSNADGTLNYVVYVLDCAEGEDAGHDNRITLGEYLSEANARRLAACWNACEGLSTEALEAGMVKELLDALTDLVGGCGKEGDLFSKAGMEKALAAIRKAEKGA